MWKCGCANTKKTHATKSKSKKYEPVPSLTVKEPTKDDPRLQIPEGKASPIHDHLIVEKEPVASPDHKPKYGQAYEI